MHWLFYNYPPKHPIEKKIWIKIRFIHEADKAVLAYCHNRKIWVAKSRIDKIRLRKAGFEIYVRKSMLG